MIACLGCGRIAFDPISTTVDGTVDSTIDRCAAELVDLGPWNAPTKIPGVNSMSADDDPTPTEDGLELIFTSARSGGLGQSDFWRARRANITDAWGPVEHIPELSSSFNENTPGLSSDALTIWFASNRTGSMGEDLWTSTRVNRSSPWSTPVRVVELASGEADRGPSLFDNDLSMMFHRSSNMNDLYLTTRPSLAAPWGPPVLLTPPSGMSSDELRPWVSPCGLEVYFQSSTRSAVTTDMNFFRMSRTDTSQPFGNLVEVTDLNSAEYDQDLRILGDRRRAYFSSARGGTNADLWEATR